MNQKSPLIVDLDGSLLNTDTLHEMLIKFLKHFPLKALLLIVWFLKGKTVLKKKLSQHVELDVVHLPYNMELLKWLAEEKKEGRPLILATGAHESIAESISKHLNIFDNVYSSNIDINCTNHNKRDLLVKAYGEKGYDYVGNSNHDLPAFKSARKAILANANSRMKKKAYKIGNVEKDFPKSSSAFSALLKAIRPHQALKNVLLLIPLLTAHQMTDIDALIHLGLGFISFSFCAFSIYIINDLLDIENDRQHPRKKERVIPSGQLSIPISAMASFCLLLLGLGTAWIVNASFFAIMIVYLLLTTLYSFWLKQYVLVDCLILAGLYTIRVIAGAMATGIELSFWLLLFSVFIFISLAFMKRYTELKAQNNEGRNALKGRGYILDDIKLLQNFGITSGYLSILILALYINSEQVVVLYSNPEVLWCSIPLMLFWISRVWLKAHRDEMHDDPVVFALTDKASLFIGGVFVMIFTIAAITGTL